MKLFCGTLSVLLLAGSAWADEKPKSYEIPYKLTSTNHVMVRLKLNGKGPFNFIMDTGAPALFVATKVAKKAGVTPDKEGWGTFEKFEMEGGLTLENFKGKIDDPFQLEGMNSLGIAGVELHGMIGFNFLAKYRITYDFTSDKLTLTELPGFTPGEVPSFGKGQGGMEFIGTIMKFLGPLLGFKGPPERRPRGFLGVELDQSGDTVVVKSVLADSPADKAGVKAGDRLVRISTEKVERTVDVVSDVSKRAAGTKVTLTVERDGSEKTLSLELGRGL